MRLSPAISRTRLGGMQSASLVLALVFMLAQMLGAAHLLLVPHAVCPEHGELVHTREYGAALSTTAPESAAKAYRSEPGTAPLDAHEHCMVSALQRQRLGLHEARDTIIAARAWAVTAGTWLGRSARFPSAIAIVLLAPKSSPPASAES